MRKKWQLIKQAYDRYPRGTEFKGLGESEVYISTGNFDFSGEDIFDVETGGWVYYSGKRAEIVQSETRKSVHPGQMRGKNGLKGAFFINEAAELTYEKAKDFLDRLAVSKQKPDLLEGKVAIRVNDEHEFKALMKHYEDKGWKCDPETVIPDIVRRYPAYVRYENFYGMAFSQHVYTKLGYEYVDFPKFSAHVGIEVRKPLLRSEDDVDLFEGDWFWEASNHDGYGVFMVYALQYQITDNSRVCVYPDNHKAFSSREAAEAWVAEQNRPKEIVLFEGKPYEVKVNINGAFNKSWCIPSGDLEKISAAYQKVKGTTE